MQNEDQVTTTSLAGLRPNMVNLTLVCKVIEKPPPRRVMVRSTGRGALVCDVKVADSTASVSLTLWNDDIELVREGESYLIENARVGVFDESMFITPARGGKITETSDVQSPNTSVNMSLPFAWKPKREAPRTKEGRSLTEASGRRVRRYVGRKSF